MVVGILEDIVIQANTISRWLNKAGYETIVCHDGDSFIDAVMRQRVDVLLLDWDVPGKSGIEVLHWSRKTFANVLPVIMLTQHDGERDIVFGLNSGADDYLIKPLREQELLARMNAQIRKYYAEAQSEKVVEYGRWVLDMGARIAKVDGRPVGLSQREFDLALLLFENIGRLVPRNVMIKQIWGSADDKYNAMLATYISKLRSRLELRSKNGLVLSTIYNYGYRLERI